MIWRFNSFGCCLLLGFWVFVRSLVSLFVCLFVFLFVCLFVCLFFDGCLTVSVGLQRKYIFFVSDLTEKVGRKTYFKIRKFIYNSDFETALVWQRPKLVCVLFELPVPDHIP